MIRTGPAGRRWPRPPPPGADRDGAGRAEPGRLRAGTVEAAPFWLVLAGPGLRLAGVVRRVPGGGGLRQGGGGGRGGPSPGGQGAGNGGAPRSPQTAIGRWCAPGKGGGRG